MTHFLLKILLLLIRVTIPPQPFSLVLLLLSESVLNIYNFFIKHV